MMLCSGFRGSSTVPSSQSKAKSEANPEKAPARQRAELLFLEQRLLLSAAGAGSGLNQDADAAFAGLSGHCPCGCTGTPAIQAEAADGVTPDAAEAKFPLSSLPVLNSNPGTHAKLVLDFNGDVARSWGSYSVPATPAYDIDGDPVTFTQTELDNIRKIWARVAEKFSPFNINVTTVDPGYLANKEVLRVVIGGDGAWTGSTIGGTAYVGSFYTNSPNIVYAFSKNLANGHVNFTTEAAAHEAGHAFGLRHQSSYDGSTKVDEYNRGDSNRAPIMGVSYYADRGVWWLGPSSSSSTTIQDDMQVLANSNNGFGYRSDDHGDSISSATPLTVDAGTISASGIISRTTDKDVFSFTTTGGTVQIRADVAEHGPTLRLRLELLDETGKQVASANTSSLGEKLEISGLPAGKYHIVIASHGQYGDVGQYTITGAVPDSEAPRLLDVEYVFQSAPHMLRFQFSGDVSSSVSTQSLRLENLTDGSVISAGDLRLEYNSSTHIAEFTYRQSNGILPSGRYRASLQGGWFTEDAHLVLNDSGFDFHFLQGDATGNGRVDIADLGIMAGNWQKQVYGPANGDFNYDGVVNVADLGILAGNWQRDLFSDQTVVASASSETSDAQVLTSSPTLREQGNGRGHGHGRANNARHSTPLVELQSNDDLLQREDRDNKMLMA